MLFSYYYLQLQIHFFYWQFFQELLFLLQCAISFSTPVSPHLKYARSHDPSNCSLRSKVSFTFIHRKIIFLTAFSLTLELCVLLMEELMRLRTSPIWIVPDVLINWSETIVAVFHLYRVSDGWMSICVCHTNARLHGQFILK